MKFTGAGCVTSNNLLYFSGDLVMQTIHEFTTIVYGQCQTVLQRPSRRIALFVSASILVQ